MSDIEPDPHPTFLEYVGIAGATKECQEAIERLLMSGADLRSALILTCQDGAISTMPSYWLLANMMK